MVSVRVTVRFFASLRELVGTVGADVDVPAESTVADVWQACVERWPDLASRAQSTALAVNREFARLDTPINNGDEVALLPPVSGGR